MNAKNKKNFCPVCGYNLGFPAWNGDSASHENCYSCGIEFGYDDVPAASGVTGTKEEIYKNWRQRWIKEGMPWTIVEAKKPLEWNPKEQLKNISLDLSKE